jgi:hypothetical protein
MRAPRSCVALTYVPTLCVECDITGLEAAEPASPQHVPGHIPFPASIPHCVAALPSAPWSDDTRNR